jgi:hypothetical protein
MYTIELTRGTAWDAPVVATHYIQPTRHLVDVERLACSLIQSAPREVRPRPTDYRILNQLGRCVSSSAAAAASPVRKWRAGRTYWGDAR